ncbi:hypothetical protein LOTGIDRAFT_205793 [Lottia gigantea]|uniref:Dehydrogenase/reductase SDR family member 11 n=1 Tax=Lottia gigantea TaxID=225164 RepID=V3Z8C6_LOTGI|nr:hypothetical protein LOTGIDRAFT_205793 [Lottia gigantea]ESO87133.1 hypothetical protein LOTGIDRAFT_205793 [Lottia gigantea]
MERWSGRVALVTGASEGIGAAIVKALVGHGMKVVACARSLDKLQKIKEDLKAEKGSVYPIKCDLTKEEEILKMFKEIKSDSNLGGVDVCINNAGLAHNAPLLSGKTEDWANILNVNVLACAIVNRESYQSMKERGIDDGQLIFINSISGHRVLARSSVHFYSVSKFAVTALVEGTRQELRELNSHIRVTGISPGVVETEFSERMNQSQEKAQKFYSSIKCMVPKDIADTVVFILQSPPHVEINDVIMRPTEQTG